MMAQLHVYMSTYLHIHLFASPYACRCPYRYTHMYAHNCIYTDVYAYTYIYISPTQVDPCRGDEGLQTEPAAPASAL